MPDGLYTARGWQPLPFSESDYHGAAKPHRISLLWGAVCLAGSLVCMVVSGLLRRPGKSAVAT